MFFSCQRALYGLGVTGIPIINVNNNCSTGSTALFQASTLVRAGAVECALALGFERMRPGSLRSNWDDRANPGALLAVADREVDTAAQLAAALDGELTPEESTRLRKKIDWHILPLMCSAYPVAVLLLGLF